MRQSVLGTMVRINRHLGDMKDEQLSSTLDGL